MKVSAFHRLDQNTIILVTTACISQMRLYYTVFTFITLVSDLVLDIKYLLAFINIKIYISVSHRKCVFLFAQRKLNTYNSKVKCSSDLM